MKVNSTSENNDKHNKRKDGTTNNLSASTELSSSTSSSNTDIMVFKSQSDNKSSNKTKSIEHGISKCINGSSKKVLDKYCKFKNPKFQMGGFSTKTKIWKNLKQILLSQKAQATKVTYTSIDAPSPMTPVKKYSDISGLISIYTDPATKLRYSNSSEYQHLQSFSHETVLGLLILRKADM